MRKAFSGILAAVIILSLCAATAFAAGRRGGRYFADADGDGTCDNAGSACMYTDADQDGVCDVCGANHGGCPNGAGAAFVDADGDGVCDNRIPGQGQGSSGCGSQGGRGHGFRGGRGR